MEHTGLPHDHGEEQNHTAAMRELLRGEAHFQSVADIFRQLGDPSRIRIFWLLCHCEECVVNIADMVEMSSPAVSHHLRTLRSSGLLVTRRDGKEVYYHAADTAQARLLHEMVEQVKDVACPQWRSQAEQVQLIREMHDYLTEHMDWRITIDELAGRFYLSKYHMMRRFRQETGYTIHHYLMEKRLMLAQQLLRTGAPLAQVCFDVGYQDYSTFSRAYKNHFGRAPSAVTQR